MVDWKRWLRANWDRVGAWSCIVIGALLLFAGWHGISRTAYPAEQLPYLISGGIGGALLVALGATLLISADLRDEWRKLDRIERRLAALEPKAERAQPEPVIEEPSDAAAGVSDDTTETPLVANGTAPAKAAGRTRKAATKKATAASRSRRPAKERAS